MSNLTEEQQKLVRTPEFKAWFGDWENDPENSSKVVDENGEPLVVYHGTNTNFNTFKQSEKVGSHGEENQLKGVYFTDDKEVADWYANSERNIKSCFLNIRNPLFSKDITEIKNNLNTEDSDILYDIIISENYDGVLIYKGFYTLGMQKLYLCFYPNQIKLADGTNTTFNPLSNSIIMEQGGQVGEQIVNELILYKDGAEYDSFDSDEDFRWWLKNHYLPKGNDMWNEDPDNYDDAEELSINDEYIVSWFNRNDGSEYRLHEQQRELTLSEKIQLVIDEVELEYDVHFNKSSNNSWYYKDYENDLQLRVSDHEPLYPCEMGRCFNIVVEDAGDLDGLKDGIINDANLHSKNKSIMAKGGSVEGEKLTDSSIKEVENQSTELQDSIDGLEPKQKSLPQLISGLTLLSKHKKGKDLEDINSLIRGLKLLNR